MANQYKNKVVYNGTTLIDLSDTTAVQSDVASGKYFYLATGEKVEGTNSGSGGGESSETTYINIVPQQTFTPTSDYTLLTSTEALTNGEKYRYIVNGIEKTGTATELYGSVVLGSYSDYSGGTGGAFESVNNVVYYDTKLRTEFTVQVDRIVEGSGGGGGSTDSNPLKGKIVAFTGDSICAGSGYTGGYARIIGTNYNMTVQNIGTAEGTIVKYQNYFCISESISDLRTDANYVILEGGGNDAWYGTQVIPLGTLSSGYSATLDTTTFAGAFESMLKSAIARFPNAKIGYIFPHKCIANFDSPNGTYRNMAISALEKWGIPYCDLNISVPPLGYIDDLKSTYTAGDGIHPNELGYRTFYVPKIVAFMQTMLTDKTLVNKTVTENGTYLALDDSVDGYDSVTVNVAGGGGVTRTNIVPEQTVTGSGYLALTASEVMVAGQNYAYTFDGEERIGTAVAANGNIYLGDVDAFWESTGGAFATDGYTMYVMTNVDGSHTVKIDKIAENGGGSSGGDTSNNPLKEKILAVTGDSICAGAGFTGGYAGIIGSEQEMTVQNVAVGGGTVAYINANTFCISRSISSMRSDADFVLLEGGGNDADSGVPLGTLSSGYTATLDDTTFAGAIESMFKAALARFPDKKIGYVFIHKCASGYDSRVPNSYYGIAKSACEKWGIPYLDLNTQVPPLNYIADLKSTYTANGDGYHPNELGYKTFYVPKITAFLNTMLTDNSLINKTVTTNGTYLATDDSADGYSSVTVNVSSASAMNVQTEQFTSRRNNTALGSVVSLTCSTAGTYDVYWTCARSSTSGTWGSQLYINGTAYGTENTTFSNNVQNNHLTGVTIPANATVAIYGRSRSGYYIYVPQLTIVQTA